MRLRTFFGGGCAVLIAGGLITHAHPAYFVGVMFWGGLALIATAFVAFLLGRAWH